MAFPKDVRASDRMVDIPADEHDTPGNTLLRALQRDEVWPKFLRDNAARVFGIA